MEEFVTKNTETRITELREYIEDAKDELRSLIKEQEKVTATEEWTAKVENLNDAQLEALEEAVRLRAANTQKVGVEGIDTTLKFGNVGDAQPIEG